MRRNSGVACAIASGVVLGFSMGVGTAEAQRQSEPFGGVALGITAGTLGIGVEGSIKAADWLVLRANISGFAYGRDETYDGNRFALDAKLLSGGLIADIHPFSGGFRISLGGRYHKMEFEGAASADTYTIGSNTYTRAQIGSLHAAIEGNTIVPYFGIGYDSAHFSTSRWSFSGELGALYLGDPKVRLSTDRTVAGLAVDLKSEENKINSDIKHFGFYPVAQLALKYRF